MSDETVAVVLESGRDVLTACWTLWHQCVSCQLCQLILCHQTEAHASKQRLEVLPPVGWLVGVPARDGVEDCHLWRHNECVTSEIWRELRRRQTKERLGAGEALKVGQHRVVMATQHGREAVRACECQQDIAFLASTFITQSCHHVVTAQGQHRPHLWSDNIRFHTGGGHTILLQVFFKLSLHTTDIVWKTCEIGFKKIPPETLFLCQFDDGFLYTIRVHSAKYSLCKFAGD